LNFSYFMRGIRLARIPATSSLVRRPIKLSVLALALLASCATPTLPLPPPLALSTPPDSNGIVTVTGSVLPDAFVFVVNNQTEEGVIGRADSEGNFSLRLRAQAGDYLTVWQRDGSDEGPSIDVAVPSS
jgi:hypothetical protein